MERGRRTIVVRLPRSAAGKRLDSALAPLVEGFSRTALQRLIRSGAVRVEGEVALRPGTVLGAGGKVTIDLGGGKEVPEVVREERELPVVFADEHLAVVDKPAGMLTHRTSARGETSAADLAVARFGALPSLYGTERPGIVHRLDRDTSGLLVLGRTRAALEALKRAFQERAVEKTYLAIVRGEPRFDSEWIEKRLGRARGRRDRIGVVGAAEGREAVTYYEVRERFEGFALLAVFPKTGRTHQVRVHLASVGLPILGEKVYSPRGARKGDRGTGALAIARHALHAHALAFAHPASGEKMRFEAALPGDMMETLSRLRSA